MQTLPETNEESKMTPTLEQKIEAGFEKWFQEECQQVREGNWPFNLEDDRSTLLMGFKAAALPLHQEIAKLKEALVFACKGLGFYTDFRTEDGKKLSEIVQKFKLDEVSNVE